MLTQRDRDIINFLERFKVANTSTLAKLFFPSLRMAQIRLKYLTDNKVIKRSREYVINEYIYFLKKSKQVRHQLLLSEFYGYLNSMVSIKHFVVEKQIGNIRADAITGYEYRGNKYIAFIEIEISNNSINNKIDAYKRLYKTEQYKKYFNVMPILIIVTDKKLPRVEGIKIIAVKEDLSNVSDVVM